jgi:uncharacterized protein with HEPN domain
MWKALHPSIRERVLHEAIPLWKMIRSFWRTYLECIERIERYTSDGKDSFLSDTKTQDAVVRNPHTFRIHQRLSDSLKSKYPDIEWRNIAAFRNVIVHDYLGIDLDQIWDIVGGDLPSLRERVKVILENLS